MALTKIGAGWWKRGDNGDFLSLVLNDDAEDLRPGDGLLVFDNDYKERSSHPDVYLFLTDGQQGGGRRNGGNGGGRGRGGNRGRSRASSNRSSRSGGGRGGRGRRDDRDAGYDERDERQEVTRSRGTGGRPFEATEEDVPF